MSRRIHGHIVDREGKLSVSWKKTLSIINCGFLLRQIIRHRKYFEGNLLDLGCGEKPYCPIYSPLVEGSIGVDVKSSEKPDIGDVIARAEDLSLFFEENRFNVVLCTEVLEHVSDFDKVLTEIYRVLKANGKLILSVPFIYPLHEFPGDNFRFTYFGICSALKKHNFEILDIEARGGALTVFIQFFFLMVTVLLVQIEKKSKIRVFNNKIIRWLIFIPQYIYVKGLIYFKECFSENKSISKYEQFLTLGFFVVAEK